MKVKPEVCVGAKSQILTFGQTNAAKADAGEILELRVGQGFHSDPPSFREGDGIGVADDHVVENTDIDQGQGLLEPVGDLAVSRRRFRRSGWVVVGEYDRRRIMMESADDDFPDVDGAGAAAAACRLPDQPDDRRLRQLLYQCLEEAYGSLAGCVTRPTAPPP